VLTADPLVGSVPLQEPDAVQLDAFVVVQLNTADCPAVMVWGLTLMSTVTIGVLELTMTLALWLFVPPVPIQVRV
jgi:hypothetical protein